MIIARITRRKTPKTKANGIQKGLSTQTQDQAMRFVSFRVTKTIPTMKETLVDDEAASLLMLYPTDERDEV